MPTPAQLTQGNYNSVDANNQIADGHFLIGYDGNNVAGSERRYSVGDLKKYINHGQTVHGHGAANSAEGGHIVLCSSDAGDGVEAVSWNFDTITRAQTSNVTATTEWVRLFSADTNGFLQATSEGRWYFATDGQVGENIHGETNGVVTIGPRFLRSIPGGETNRRWRAIAVAGEPNQRTFQWMGQPGESGLADILPGSRIACGRDRAESHTRTALGIVVAINGDSITVHFDRAAGNVGPNVNYMLFQSEGGLTVKGYATSDDVFIDNLKVENNSTWTLNHPRDLYRVKIDPTGSDVFNSRVDGQPHKLGKITTRALDVTCDTNEQTAVLNVYGTGQSDALVYVGQEMSHGFGLLYNGDDNPNALGNPDDCMFFTRSQGVSQIFMKTRYNTTNCMFGSFVKINDGTFTNPAFALDVVGDIRASGNIIAQSDGRYKSDTCTIDNSLEKVKRLRGVSYVKADSKRADMGLVAQELEQVLPELVTTHKGADYSDEKSVNYNGVIPVLIEAIKEQQQQIEQLQQRSS